MTYSIYVGSAHDTVRPYSFDDPENLQPLDNWLLVGQGTTCEQALLDFIEGLNAEEIDLTNSWVRLIKREFA